MSLVYAVVLAAASFILFAWGVGQHRRPVPARWTQSAGLGSAFAMVCVSLYAGVFLFTVMAVSAPRDTLAGLTLWGVAAMSLAIVACVYLVPRLWNGALPQRLAPRRQAV